MILDKLTIISLISFTAIGVWIGRKSVKPEQQLITTTKSEKQNLTARRIVSTVTKYISIPGPTKIVTRVPDTITKTVYIQPKEVSHDNISTQYSPIFRYSLGLGSSGLPANFGSLEGYGAIRLGELPISIYTTFQPSKERIAIGLRYDF